MSRSTGRLLTALLAIVCAVGSVSIAAAADVITTLEHQNAFVSRKEIADGHARPGDLQRLESAAASSARQGVPEKFALVHTFPGTSIAAAAHELRNTLGFSGVLILLAPGHLAISSDRLSDSEMNGIYQRAAPRCQAQGYTACAIFAGRQATAQVLADQQSSGHSSGALWLIVVVVLGGIALFALTGGRRRRGAAQSYFEDLRRAANNTLSQVDDAVQRIESAAPSLSTDARAEYDRALSLRDAAKQEMSGSTPEMLTQANQDAAHALLALQGVMRSAGVQSPADNPLNAPVHRCFYCGRTDRPPYTTRTITDEKGNSMQVEVCAVDEARLEQGERPQVQTVSYSGMQVPWYAVPGNPWYYAYGGPTWQYWLPFVIGMDVGGWFGGGGWGPFVGGPGWGVGGLGDVGQGGFGDASGGDFGGGWDGGGGFGDAGGGDFGGGDGGGGWS
jgi:hypothetical protein